MSVSLSYSVWLDNPKIHIFRLVLDRQDTRNPICIACFEDCFTFTISEAQAKDLISKLLGILENDCNNQV